MPTDVYMAYITTEKIARFNEKAYRDLVDIQNASTSRFYRPSPMSQP